MMEGGARRILIAGSLTTLSVGMGIGVQRAVLPLLTERFATEGRYYVLLILLPLLSFGLFKGLANLLSGYLSDKLGRKSSIVLGAALFLVGSYVLVESARLEMIIAATLMMGWSQGLVDSGVMVLLSEAGGKKRHGLSVGIMESSVYGGYTIGALGAGFLSQLRPLSDVNYLTLIGGLLAFLVSAVGLTDIEVEGEPIPTREAYSLCLRSSTLRLTYLMGHVGQFSDALVWGILPVYLASRGFGFLEIGAIQALNTLTWAIMMPLSGRISDLFGRRLPILLGFIVKGAAILLIGILEDPLGIALASLVLGVGVGLYYPVFPAISVDAAPPTVRGRSVGLYNAMRDFGYMTGAMALGYVGATFGLRDTFPATATLLLLSSFLILLMKETRPFWPAHELVVSHVREVRGSVEALTSLILTYSRGIRDERSFLAVKEHEERADKVKEDIDRQLWLSSMSGQDKADLARLTGRIDRIAAYALGASRMLWTLSPEEIPRDLMSTFKDMSLIARWTMNRFERAVTVVRENPEEALRLIGEIDDLETAFDELHRKAVDQLLGVRMDVIKLINLRDFVELFENMVDAIEDAAEVLRVLAFKHMAWPVGA